jgi:hypothetical protein
MIHGAFARALRTLGRPGTTRTALGRAARLCGAATALLAALAVVEHRTGDSTPGLVAVTAIVPLVLAPAAVRLLAHPGDAPLPPNPDRAATIALTMALAVVAAGLALAIVSGSAVAGPARLAITLPVLAAVTATTASLVSLHRRLPPRRTAADPGGRRPDLVDDLATLTARLWPGSTPARALARLNRGLDVWGWSPRLRRDPRRTRRRVTAAA